MVEDKSSTLFSKYILPLEILLVLVSGGLFYALIQIYSLSKHVELLTQEVASTTAMQAMTLSQLSGEFGYLSKQTAGITSTLTNAQQSIEAVTSKVGGVEQAVGSISGKVGTLQKLAEVDDELLKKYSKVYFMNENYTPAHLAVIPPEYLYSTARTEQFLTEALPHLKSMLDAAKREGVTIYIKSAYRSFSEQKSLKSFYKVTYGAGTANTFSADQGYSEHQLGTTIDFITTGMNGALAGFDRTDAYTWLTNNAHKYGFTLSYPKGNNYYMYEPWHWRYVGVALATHLYNNKLHFYDLDQRQIDQYLSTIFD